MEHFLHIFNELLYWDFRKSHLKQIQKTTFCVYVLNNHACVTEHLLHTSKIGGWGWKTERSGDPHRESKPSAHAPAPHARHDRSMARSGLVARMIFEEKFPVVARRVQRPIGPTSFSVTHMKRFLKWSWGRGHFKSRTNSFEACIVSSDRDHGIQRCDPRCNNKVSVNRWLISARNYKVSVTHRWIF